MKSSTVQFPVSRKAKLHLVFSSTYVRDIKVAKCKKSWKTQRRAHSIHCVSVLRFLRLDHGVSTLRDERGLRKQRDLLVRTSRFCIPKHCEVT